MSFQTLQDELREHIRARIRRRELTGSGLARAAGFPQGHLSNFLNSRRGLSLDSMDRLLEALGIGVLDLIAGEEIQRRAGVSNAHHDIAQVPLVSPEHAMMGRMAPEHVLEHRAFSKAFLRRLRPSVPHHRGDWQRFVVVKLSGEGMHQAFARDAVAATALIDRHYNSLEPYRRGKPNLYMVNFGEGCSAGYLSLVNRTLVLHTSDPRRKLQGVPVARGDSYSQQIIGRIAQVILEV